MIRICEFIHSNDGDTMNKTAAVAVVLAIWPKVPGFEPGWGRRIF
jgi:hypothetical protein